MDSLETFAKAVNKFFTGTLLGKAEKAETVDNLWITLLEAISEQTNTNSKGHPISAVKRSVTVWRKRVTYAEVAEKQGRSRNVSKKESF
jgi:hypothetical protein